MIVTDDDADESESDVVHDDTDHWWPVLSGADWDCGVCGGEECEYADENHHENNTEKT